MMLSTLMVSLLFFSVGTVVLASGIFTLQSKHKAPANRVFFALTTAVTVWSAGMSLSTVANDAVSCEVFRRVSAIGWSTVYAILLHFILIITGKSSSLKKRWLYVCIYLPALVFLFAFAVPNGMNPYPYNLQQTEFGWINVAQNNLWDWMFYVYYIGFTLLGLFLLYWWGKKAEDNHANKKSRTILLSIITALVLGTITDVVLSSLYSELPQMAPAIMLIPVLSIHHALQKDSFGITEGIDKKTSYILLFTSVFVYIILSALQVLLPYNSFAIGSIVFNESVIRGIIVQIQLLISVYLVLKENRPGYISAVLMNIINLLSAIVFLIRYESAASLPGIISYVGVLVIISLIKAYKEKNAAYIKRINTQAVREEFYSSVFMQAPVGISIMNDKNHTKSEEFEDININPAYAKILGRSKEELQRTTWAELTVPQDLDTDMAYFKQFRNGELSQYSIEKRYIRPDGSIVWVNMLVAPFGKSDGKFEEHLCIITDITERKETEAALKYNNEHVMLTGLYNRDVLEKTLISDALQISSNKRALVCINLFAMHVLSMRYGYHYNQTMLRNIAGSLKAFCNDNYSLFDTNEYRFVYYVKGYEDEKELTVFCEKVSDAVSSYLYVHGIKCAIGILQIENTIEQDTSELMKKVMDTSETAANSNNYKSNILFYSPELVLQFTRENEISNEITEISDGKKPERLYLQFQPIFDIASNMVCGFEALARLNSEKYGLIPPSEFITIAEKTNKVVPLSEKIILQALRFLKKLKESGYDTIAVSINISMVQVLEDGFATRFLNMIQEMHIEPQNVGIELTESVFATKRAEVNAVVDVLKAAGIKVLIDDFGTGYSSFARERELNIDCLKIDKSFIDKLMKLDPQEAITGDIISMAHKLGHCVVAEGVEHERQLIYLRDHCCDRIQGFLISEPLDEEDAIRFLKSKNKYDCHSDDSQDSGW